jgi:hypothetical protein
MSHGLAKQLEAGISEHRGLETLTDKARKVKGSFLIQS